MGLTYEKLIRFDLVEDLEKEILANENLRDRAAEFLKIFYEIMGVDQFIRELPSSPYATEPIIRSEMVRAIGSTLAIEGIMIGEEEIKKSFQKTSSKESPEERVSIHKKNSDNVYKYIIDLVEKYEGEFICAEEHIKKIHKLFTDKIDYVGNTPGQYRDIQTIFGEPPKDSLCETRSDINTAISNLITWLNKGSSGFLSGNIIVKAIMAHYYLTEIHPFGDGNGRTARALEALVLYSNHINTYCFWSLANFWSRNRGKYIQYLDGIRSTYNPWEFLLWGTKGYLQEIKRIKGLVLKKVKELMFIDYARYLWRNKPRKTSRRFMIALELLVDSGRIPLDKFYSLPVVRALYSSICLLYTSPSPRDQRGSRMPSSA